MDVAHNIRKRRLELGISQDSLARSLGYKSRSTIAKIEAGENDIPLSRLLALAQALDTTADALLAGVDLRTSSESNARPTKGETSRNVAVILAGGKSNRNRQNIPNQYINVQGKPVIVYSMEAYQRHPSIDGIYVVCTEEWRGITRAYAEEYGISKLVDIVLAGKSGIASAHNAVNHLINRGFKANDVVVFQESTRPFVTEEMISKLLLECRKCDGAVICERRDDCVQFLVDGAKQEYLDRNKVVNLQSPEAYFLGALQDLFDKAIKKSSRFSETCISMLMFNLGFKLHFCEGERNNLKLVRQEDMIVFDALLKNRK